MLEVIVLPESDSDRLELLEAIVEDLRNVQQLSQRITEQYAELGVIRGRLAKVITQTPLPSPKPVRDLRGSHFALRPARRRSPEDAIRAFNEADVRFYRSQIGRYNGGVFNQSHLDMIATHHHCDEETVRQMLNGHSFKDCGKFCFESQEKL